jgi:glycosyltransferase involved in cell wall biosynthesis
MSKKILWWGRFDESYSRNHILRTLMLDLNFDIVDFKPLVSKFGYQEALIKLSFRPDLIWVPCFRHRDLLSARKWADLNKIPLFFDPLISSWDKLINERERYPINSDNSKNIKLNESKILNASDFLIVDTDAHKKFFNINFNVPLRKIKVVNVGADESLFFPDEKKIITQKKEILFYGSFLELHGIDVITEAATKSNNINIIWTLLGNYKKYKKNITFQGLNFEETLPIEKLGKRINQADILLGIFSASEKANNVIPNKVFQSLACGKPIITRKAKSYPGGLNNKNNGLIFINPNDPSQLLNEVQKLVINDKNLINYGIQARKTYEKYFSNKIIRNQLANILSSFL